MLLLLFAERYHLCACVCRAAAAAATGGSCGNEAAIQ